MPDLSASFRGDVQPSAPFPVSRSDGCVDDLAPPPVAFHVGRPPPPGPNLPAVRSRAVPPQVFELVGA